MPNVSAFRAATLTECHRVLPALLSTLLSIRPRTIDSHATSPRPSRVPSPAVGTVGAITRRGSICRDFCYCPGFAESSAAAQRRIAGQHGALVLARGCRQPLHRARLLRADDEIGALDLTPTSSAPVP